MSEEQKIRVVIADDQELVRAGFAMVIGSQPDMADVGQARGGAEAVALAETLHPDVVLMDVRMPGMDGIQATEYIRNQLHSKIPIIALTADVTTVVNPQGGALAEHAIGSTVELLMGQIALPSLYYTHRRDMLHSVHAQQFAAHEAPPEGLPVVQLLKLAGLVPSTSEAIRQIAGGGVRLDSEKVSDKGLLVTKGSTVVAQVGKRKYARVSLF